MNSPTKIRCRWQANQYKRYLVIEQSQNAYNNRVPVYVDVTGWPVRCVDHYTGTSASWRVCTFASAGSTDRPRHG